MERKIAWLGVHLSCTLVLCAIAGTPLNAGRHVPTLNVFLTTASDVTNDTRRVLIDEATRIWAQAGVHLSWESPEQSAPPVRTLRLLAIPRPQTVTADKTMVVGELLRLDGSKAVAMVSVSQAQWIVERLGSHPRSHGQLLGVVLGRAAAHEIGHYLLNTPTHAAHGLMRARFDEDEFARPHSRAFDLDSGAHAWIAQQPEGALPLSAGTFSYRR